MFANLFQFSGYSLLGNAANAGTQQGVSMIVNVFAGVTTNAAIGVSGQLSHGIYNFITNFQVAFNPTLIKTYAQNEFEQLKALIFRVSKYSYFLMFIISLPVLIYCEEFLEIWLKTVPEYTPAFCRLTIISLLIDTIAEPLWKTVQASGIIKRYQLTVSFILLFNLPLAYFLLSKGFSPVSVFIVKLILNFLTYIYRFYYTHNLIKLPIIKYIKCTLIPIVSITLLSALVAIVINSTNWHFVVGSVVIGVLTIAFVILLGLTSEERIFAVNIIKQRFKK